MMKKYLAVVSGLIAGATLMFAAAPGIAATVDVNIVVPGVYVQPRPTYIQPRYENDWHERQLRALEWRDNPRNHGQVVSDAAHERNDRRKEKHGKHHRKDKHGH